jgi:molybdopterin synthase sulfur carrier subunit
MITIKVHSILGIKKILGKGKLDVVMPSGSDLEALITRLVRDYGETLSTYLYGAEGQGILPHIRLMINGRDIEFLHGLKTDLHDGDEILILPPISGG